MVLESGELLDTTENVALNLELNNVMVGNVNELAKSYSYPLTLPRTATNDVALDFPSFINTSTPWVAKMVSVFVHGVLVLVGELVLLGATEAEVSVAIQTNRKLAWLAVRKMTELTELGYVWQTTQTDWYVELLLSLANTSNPVGLSGSLVRVDVSGFWYETLIIGVSRTDILATLNVLAGLINADSARNNGHADVIEITGSYSQVFTNFRITRVSPTKPFYVVPEATYDEKAICVFEYAVGNATTYDIRSKQWIDFVDANPANFIFRYTELTMIPQDDDAFAMPINRHTAGSYDIIDDLSVTSPQLNVKKGLEFLVKTFGYRLESDFLQEPSIALLFFANNHSNPAFINFGNDISSSSNRLYAFPEYFFFYKDKFPAMTLLDWLDSFSKLFCLYITLDHVRKIVTIRAMNTILSEQAQTTYSTAPKYSVTVPENAKKGHTFKLASPASSAAYQTQFERHNQQSYSSLVLGKGETVIKSALTFLDVRWHDDQPQTPEQPCFFTGWWSSLPNYDKIKYHKEDVTQQWGLRGNSPKSAALLFDGGFYNGKSVSSFSTHDETLHWGVADASNTFGLYNKRWRKFLAFMNRAQLVKRKIYLSLTEFAALDLSKKVRIDNQTYFIKKLRVQLTHKTGHELVAEVELLTV